MPKVQGLKQGASFRAAIVFTAEEWAQLSPIESVTCQSKVAGSNTRYPVTINQRQDLMSFILSANTDSWPIGNHSLDVAIVRNGFKIYIPELTNVDIPILDPVTE